ncbi:MAG: hypothetical protein WC895_02910 [Candidatus Shapirobacteria bacterium]|jgi:hypothetical protein
MDREESLQLETTGSFYSRISVVEVLIYLAEGDVFHPEAVDYGFAELRTATGTAVARKEFDKFGGNSDGSFKVFFLHPPVYDSQWAAGIKAYTELHVGDDVYRQEVPVQQEDQEHIPLEEQSTESTFRSEDEGGIQAEDLEAMAELDRTNVD